MAVVVTLVQTKQMKIYVKETTRNTVQTIQNTVNTSTHITKTSTHYKTHTYTHPDITKPPHTHAHTLQNKLKQPQYKIHTKLNSHKTVVLISP